MAFLWTAIIAATLCFLNDAAPMGPKEGTTEINYLMPEVQPKVPDTYLCTPMKMNSTPTYIVGYKPHANMAIAHHILLYGCSEPGRRSGVWNCGEMAAGQGNTNYEQRPVCASGAKIVYAWAMDAPALKLPPDVGFEVGGDTGINYLVLQVHYKDVTPFLPPKNEKDSSGITMVTTKKPTSRKAGVYLLGTGGFIPKKSTAYMETACEFEEPIEIHPFAFRTHAHSLGQVITGYRIRNGKWTEIGRRSPKDPEMFYNATTTGVTVHPGDILAARCTMINDLDHDVQIGSTQNDEMCNFYIMYYVNGPDIMKDSYCFSEGPTSWYWSSFRNRQGINNMHLENVPKEASVIPGTHKIIKQTVADDMYYDYADINDNVYADDMILDGGKMDGINQDLEKMTEEEIEELMAYLKGRPDFSPGDYKKFNRVF